MIEHAPCIYFTSIHFPTKFVLILLKFYWTTCYNYAVPFETPPAPPPESKKVEYLVFSSVKFSCSVTSDSLRPHGLQTTGLRVDHEFLEFSQTCVHWVGHVIQPSHHLSSPSPPAFNLSQHQGLFQWVSSSHHVAKVLGLSASLSVLPMNVQVWFPLGWTGWVFLQSKGFSLSFFFHLFLPVGG